MRSFFTWIARFLAGVFASLFVVSLLAALLLVSAENRLFKAETYKKALIAQNLYDRLPKLLAEQIITNLISNPCKEKGLVCLSTEPSPLRTCFEQKLGPEVVSELSTGVRMPTPVEADAIESCTNEFGPIPNPLIAEPPVYLKYLTVQDWEILINTLIPPAQMKTVSEQTLDSLFNFLNGETDKAVISLGPIKQNLSKNSAEAIQRVLSAQPACTDEELLALGTQLATGAPNNQVKLCNPPQELMPTILPIAEMGLQTEISGIQDEIPLFAPDVQAMLHITVGTMRMAMRLSPLFPLVFLMLMTLLVVRSLSEWLKWWGIPLTITGGLALLFGLTVVPLTQIILPLAADRNTSIYALRFATTVMDVVTAIAWQIAIPVIVAAVILLLVGIGMLIGARLVNKRKVVEV